MEISWVWLLIGGVMIGGLSGSIAAEEVKKKMRRIEAKLDMVLAELQRTRDR